MILALGIGGCECTMVLLLLAPAVALWVVLRRKGPPTPPIS
jgi:hypothetical protein